MDLSTFQLVDAINDMDMLRNLSDQQQRQQHHQQQQQGHVGQEQQQQHYQQQQQPQQASNHNAYDQLHGDIDLLFQQQNQTSSPHMHSFLPTTTSSAYKNHHPSTNQIMPTSSPHYRSTPLQQPTQHHDYMDQEDILTPLISPAMTPSFSYQVQQQQKQHHHSTNIYNNEVDFSPLSSPAILPQMDRPVNNSRPSRQSFQDQLNSASATNTAATSTADNNNGDSYKDMSANQIREQYEQLEHAKLLITQKLSELQKSQLSSTTTYNDDQSSGYQKSLLSESTGSSSSLKDSSSKNHGMLPPQQQKQQMNTMGGHHHHMMSNSSRPSSPNQSPPHMEPATPASLMNMKMNNTNTSKLQFSSSGRTQHYYSSKMPYLPTATTSAPTVFHSPIMNTAPPNDMMSPMMTPTQQGPTHTTTTAAPLSPLALQPRKTSRSSSNLKEKQSCAARKKQKRRESTDPAKSSSSIHASPRALKPLLISPTLNPNINPLPSSILTASSSSSRTSAVHSVEDAERILATRSNYQNLMEGKGAALGIAFSTQIKSGLEVRRTAHKAAEQKRRDSLKEWFDRLRREVEDGYVKRQKTLMSQVIQAQEMEKNSSAASKKKDIATEDGEDDGAATAEGTTAAMKPLSKVLLLQYAYEYIASLKDTLQERDKTIEELLNHEGGAEESSRGGFKRTREEENHPQQQQEVYDEEEDDNNEEEDDEEDDEFDNEMIHGGL